MVARAMTTSATSHKTPRISPCKKNAGGVAGLVEIALPSFPLSALPPPFHPLSLGTLSKGPGLPSLTTRLGPLGWVPIHISA